MNNKSRNRLWQFPNMLSREFKCNPVCVILWDIRDKTTLNFGNAIFSVKQFTCYDQLEVSRFWTSEAHEGALHRSIYSMVNILCVGFLWQVLFLKDYLLALIGKQG